MRSSAPIRTARLLLRPVAQSDARLLRDGAPAWPVFDGYDWAQLRVSAGVLLDHPSTRTMFVIEHGDDGVIGFVALDEDPKEAAHAFVSFIEITPARCGQRLAREALDAMMGAAATHGTRRLTAEIAPDNDRSKRLFERVGFRLTPGASRPGGHQRWEWSAEDAATTRVREALAIYWSTAVNHEDVLRDIEPFWRPFAHQRSAPGRPTTHRLLQLVEAVEADRDAIHEKRVSEHLPELIELRHVANTLRTWSTHAVGAKIVANLRDSNSFAHNIVVLSAYRLLHTWGNNAIELVEEDPVLPTSDLRVHIDAASVATEVKVPRELRDGRQLTTMEAERVAEDAMRSSRPQRRGQPSFVLLVGGFQVPDTSLVLVSSALERYVEKEPSRSNVAGAIALTVGRHPDDIPRTIERDTPLAGVHAQFAAQLHPALFQLGVAARVVRNRRYMGPVPILRFREPGRGFHLP